MTDRLTPEERAEARALCDAATIWRDDWMRQMMALVPRLLDELDAVEAERDALRERLAYVEELAQGWAEHESSGLPPRVVGAIFLDAVRGES